MSTSWNAAVQINKSRLTFVRSKLSRDFMMALIQELAFSNDHTFAFFGSDPRDRSCHRSLIRIQTEKEMQVQSSPKLEGSIKSQPLQRSAVTGPFYTPTGTKHCQHQLQVQICRIQKPNIVFLYTAAQSKEYTIVSPVFLSNSYKTCWLEIVP